MGYWFWDNNSKKVIRSRDVTFNENALYKDEVAGTSTRSKSSEDRSQVVFDGTVEGPGNSGSSDEDGGNGASGSEASSDDIEASSQRSEDEDSESDTSVDNRSEAIETEAIVTPRRSTRERRPPKRYSPSANYLLLTENGEPESYPEALRMKDSIQWKKAMEDEMSSLDKNKTWSLVKLPAKKKALQNK